MFCPFCRTALPEGSKFCSACGKTISAAPAPNATAVDTTGASPPTAEQRPAVSPSSLPGDLPGPARDRAMPLTHASEELAPERRSERSTTPVAYTEPEPEPRPWMVPALAALLALLLIGGGGVWLLRRSQGAPVTAVPAVVPRGPSVLHSTPAPPSGPPVAAQPAKPAKPQGMPEDISRYLRFLQGVEAQRKQYEGQLTNRMLAMIPNLLMPNFDADNVQPPDQQMVRQYDGMAQEYGQAILRFQAASRQIQVPLACRKLHAYYSTALSLNPRLIVQTAQSLASGNYSGLLSMRGTVGKQIEDNYQAADQELANICNQYGVRKPFDIGNDTGGSSVLLP